MRKYLSECQSYLQICGSLCVIIGLQNEIMGFFSDFLYKSIYCGYSIKLHLQFDAIQMGTHNICLYKEANQKITELLDCALTEICAVIR